MYNRGKQTSLLDIDDCLYVQAPAQGAWDFSTITLNNNPHGSDQSTWARYRQGGTQKGMREWKQGDQEEESQDQGVLRSLTSDYYHSRDWGGILLKYVRCVYMIYLFIKLWMLCLQKGRREKKGNNKQDAPSDIILQEYLALSLSQ